MTRKERLMATLRGEPVDRPAVCFYELDGYAQDETNPEVFNIFQDPSWKMLLDLVREKSDRIVTYHIPFVRPVSELDKRTKRTTYYDERGRIHEETEIHLDSCVLHKHTCREQDIDTLWILEDLIKDEEELEAWLELPEEEIGVPDYRGFHAAEAALGDSGIVMLDTGDAVCVLADLLGMENFMIFAMTEQELMERALDKIHRQIKAQVSRIAEDQPGHLWRICGPEYACAPYLPPHLYKRFVLDYDKELVEIIHKNHSYVRIHQHGRQKDILDYTVATGCDGIDPIEPIPHGDISLLDVRKKYGKNLVLFGNIEIADIENLPQEEFREVVKQAIADGTYGEGRGFVLMPTACPLGRHLSENTYRNYKIMIELAEQAVK